MNLSLRWTTPWQLWQFFASRIRILDLLIRDDWFYHCSIIIFKRTEYTLGVWVGCERLQVKFQKDGRVPLFSEPTKSPPSPFPSSRPPLMRESRSEQSSQGKWNLLARARQEWVGAFAQFETPTWRITLYHCQRTLPLYHCTQFRFCSCCQSLCAWRLTFALWRSLSLTVRRLSLLSLGRRLNQLAMNQSINQSITNPS